MDDDTRIDIRANNYSTPDTPIVYCRVANKVILDNVEISPEDHTLIFEKIDAYEPTIQKDMYDYRPHTPEYPDMEVLFNVETHRTRSEYAYDGALCKPDGYDEFFSEIEDILEPYIPEN